MVLPKKSRVLENLEKYCNWENWTSDIFIKFVLFRLAGPMASLGLASFELIYVSRDNCKIDEKDKKHDNQKYELEAKTGLPAFFVEAEFMF